MKKLFLLSLTIAIVPFFAFAQIDSVKVTDSLKVSSDYMYQKGLKAAEQNYKGYKNISTITFVSSALFLGLSPIIAGGALLTPPNLKNINDPLLKDLNYYKGYFEKAKSIKNRKVSKNWLIGTGVCIGLYTVIGVTILANGNFIK